MIREDFLKEFFDFLKENSFRWIPEEGTASDMFDIIKERIEQHGKSIKEILHKKDGGT